MKKSTAILDVLTNSIGALLILVVLFVKLMGDDSASRSVALASTDQGLCPSPRIYIRIDPRMAASKTLELSILERGSTAGSARFEWRPLLEPARAIPDSTITSYSPGGPIVLWSPARPGTNWTIRARPLGPTSLGDAIDITLFVTGAHLDLASPGQALPQRHYRARWLSAAEETRIKPVTATRPQPILVRSRFFPDAVRLTLELPDKAQPNQGGAACNGS